MAKQLSKEAIDIIMNDVDLSAEVTKILGLKQVSSLKETLRRNGNTVNRYDRIEAIAEAMGKTIESIQEEVPEEVA